MRVAEAVAGISPANPLQVVALPPLIMDMVAAKHGLPPERCVTDCIILRYAYAQLGITAHVRAAELTTTDTLTGTTTTHGSLEPWWQDGLLHGHGVMWLPALGILVDSTAAGQYFEDADTCDNGGPVIIASPLDPEPDDAGDDSAVRIEGQRGNLLLRYTLAPLEATSILLDHPSMPAEDIEHRRRGMNVAAETLLMLGSLPPDQLALIPHQRAAALAAAVQELPQRQTETGDYRFLLPGPGGAPAAVHLSDIPLPAGTPAIAGLV
jgi:hypothetical protein